MYTGDYVELDEPWFPKIGLGLTLWDGVFEGRQDRWLRWCEEQGRIIPTGAERAEQERERAERMLALLREHGIEPPEDA